MEKRVIKKTFSSSKTMIWVRRLGRVLGAGLLGLGNFVFTIPTFWMLFQGEKESDFPYLLFVDILIFVGGIVYFLTFSNRKNADLIEGIFFIILGVMFVIVFIIFGRGFSDLETGLVFLTLSWIIGIPFIISGYCIRKKSTINDLVH